MLELLEFSISSMAPSTPPLQQGLRPTAFLVRVLEAVLAHHSSIITRIETPFRQSERLTCKPSTPPLQQGFDAQRRGNHRNIQMIALCYKMHSIDYSSRSRGNSKHRLSQNMAQINTMCKSA